MTSLTLNMKRRIILGEDVSELCIHFGSLLEMFFNPFYVDCSFMQVSLRDPLRSGANDDELREIIGAAVCILILIRNDSLSFRNMQKTKCLKHDGCCVSGSSKSVSGFIVQVKKKKASHAGMFDIAKTANRPMIHIGG